MATVYSSRTIGYQKPKVVIGMGGMIVDWVSVSVGTAPSTNDLLYLFWIPKGAKLLYYAVSTATGIDQSTGTVATLGTKATANKFMTTTNFGQSSGATTLATYSSNNVAGIIPFDFGTTQASGLVDSNGKTLPSDFVDAFILKWTTGASGSVVASAVINAFIVYTVDPSYSEEAQ